MKMKPVFSDKERDTERDIDVTTISKVVETKETKETPISNMVNMVTKEEAENIARQYADQASERTINTALERYDSRRREEESRRIKEIEAEREAEIEAKRRRRKEDEEDTPIVSSKTVKDLQNIASIFNSLKEFSANPLQKAIEGKVGDVAAGVVERAFSPPSQHQEKDIIDRILNSNFASGLGAGLGQRGPELINSLTQNFGKEKVDGWITRGLGSGIPGAQPPGTNPGMGSISGKQQSEMEMVLSLDPNNPEHVADYANSQGGISVETARKILTIHQDDFIRQMQSRGGNVGNNAQQYRSREPGPPPRINDDLITNPPIAEDKRWDKEDEKTTAYVNELEMQNVEVETNPDTMNSGVLSGNIVSGTRSGSRSGSRSGRESITGNENTDIMAYLVGLKEAVENQNNAIFKLQSELNDIKNDKKIPIPNDEKLPNETTVSNMKTIKKGFNYVRKDKIEV